MLILAIGIGSGVGIALLALIRLCCWRRSRKRSRGKRPKGNAVDPTRGGEFEMRIREASAAAPLRSPRPETRLLPVAQAQTSPEPVARAQRPAEVSAAAPLGSPRSPRDTFRNRSKSTRPTLTGGELEMLPAQSPMMALPTNMATQVELEARQQELQAREQELQATCEAREQELQAREDKLKKMHAAQRLPPPEVSPRAPHHPLGSPVVSPVVSPRFDSYREPASSGQPMTSPRAEWRDEGDSVFL